MKKPLVLITRPQADAERFAAMLKARGYASLIAPMLQIEHAAWQTPCEPRGLILTSRHAIPALATRPEWWRLPCYVIGTETAHMLREMGCRHIYSMPTIGTLLPMIPPDLRPLFYLRGQDISHDLAAELGAEQAIVYMANAVTQLSPAVQEALKKHTIAAATFFSTRTGSVFAKLAEISQLTSDLTPIHMVAISEQVSQAISHLPWKSIAVSSAPNATAVAEAIDKLLRGQ